MKCGECGSPAKLIRASVYECTNPKCSVIRFSFIAEHCATFDRERKQEVSDAFHQFRITSEDFKVGEIACLSCGQRIPIMQNHT